eukprot:TRINITY_DN2763_c0_g2_i1.p1 TRINITY_DN2763_c0_g2~~TRINITY_DN2763_c0_g2_i1.p1  ORF type:complete len:653 (-),score=196.44 TRINITY_DN2763_c0_g2_i1:37-1812(-)
MIRDNLNPRFVKAIPLDYRFEEVQKLKFCVYDIDHPDANLNAQDFIGEVECRVSDIVTSKDSTFKGVLRCWSKPTQNRGIIAVTSEEIKENGYSLRIHFTGNKMDKKDFFGKSDPFFVISRKQGEQSVVVHKSETIKNTLDPHWVPFEISIQTLCNGDTNKELTVEVFDWNRSGNHELIGYFTTTAHELSTSAGKEFQVINRKYTSKKNYKNSGVVNLRSCETIKKATFLEYIQGGCEINLVVAIDFTASNLKPSDPKSLHFNNPATGNEYTRAIQAVGSILADYDSDRKFPCYGFGAQLPPHFREVNHCFALNGDIRNPEVHDIAGILNAYGNTINSVNLYGPTYFAPIIQTVSEIASHHSTQEDQRYYILLMLTDGEITDMQNTIDAIVNAAQSLPLSIVIVGVGNADFTNMNTLDGDDRALRSSSGKECARDIVQFVPMREFRNKPYEALAKATLEEIPGQLLSYMNARRIHPNAPVARPERIFENLGPGQPSTFVQGGAPIQSNFAPPPSNNLVGFNPPLDPNMNLGPNNSAAQPQLNNPVQFPNPPTTAPQVVSGVAPASLQGYNPPLDPNMYPSNPSQRDLNQGK